MHVFKSDLGLMEQKYASGKLLLAHTSLLAKTAGALYIIIDVYADS